MSANSVSVDPSKRIEYIDIAKGLCISLVVLSHSFQANNFEDNYLNYIILSFHMPLFFIVSGMFFKTYDSFTFFVKRKTNQLLVPFFAFYILFSIILPAMLDLVDGCFSYQKLLRSLYGWLTSTFFNQTTWFLLALFFANMIQYVIVTIGKRCHNQVIFILLISGIAGCLGVLLDYCRINIPMYIDTALSATPFFCFGYTLKNYTDFLNFKNPVLSIVLFIAAGLLFLIPVNHGKVLVLISNHFYMNPAIGYLCGVTGTIFLLLVSKYLGALSFFSYIGRYSLLILLTHQVILKIIKRYWIAPCPPPSDIW